MSLSRPECLVLSGSRASAARTSGFIRFSRLNPSRLQCVAPFHQTVQAREPSLSRPLLVAVQSPQRPVVCRQVHTCRPPGKVNPVFVAAQLAPQLPSLEPCPLASVEPLALVCEPPALPASVERIVAPVEHSTASRAPRTTPPRPRTSEPARRPGN